MQLGSSLTRPITAAAHTTQTFKHRPPLPCGPFTPRTLTDDRPAPGILRRCSLLGQHIQRLRTGNRQFAEALWLGRRQSGASFHRQANRWNGQRSPWSDGGIAGDNNGRHPRRFPRHSSPGACAPWGGRVREQEYGMGRGVYLVVVA